MTGEFRHFEQSEAEHGLLGAILESEACQSSVFSAKVLIGLSPINNTEWKNINTLVLADQRRE